MLPEKVIDILVSIGMIMLLFDDQCVGISKLYVFSMPLSKTDDNPLN